MLPLGQVACSPPLPPGAPAHAASLRCDINPREHLTVKTYEACLVQLYTHILLYRQASVLASAVTPPWRGPLVARGTAWGLGARQAGDDRGKGVHIPLKDDVVRHPPAFPAALEILHDLVHRADEDVRTLEDLGGAELRPTARQLFRRRVAMVRHLHPLH